MQTADDETHVVVIGSGPSGAMAALTLVQRGIPVTLLESGVQMPNGLYIRAAGHSVFRKRPALGMQGRHVASDDSQARWYQELVPGGLSNFWTGAVPRFAPEDFTEGERLHERYRWPVAYEELRPYYERVERVMVVTGDDRDACNLPASRVAYTRRLPVDWEQVAPYAREHGHGFTTTPLATGARWVVSRSAAPFNSYTTIIRKLRGSPHFELRLGAHALRLVWNGAKQQVDAVEYFDRAAQSERRVNAAAVVVAAGPLASTKLLLDSTSTDFPDGLGNTEGVLGHYLHDHMHEWYIVQLDRPLTRLSHTAYLTRAAYAASEPLMAAGCVIGNATSLDRVLAQAPTKTARFGIATFGSIVPVDRNYVRSHPTEQGDFDLPKLDLHIRFGDDAQRNMAAARDRLLAVLGAAGYRAEIQGALPTFAPGTSVHFGGTVRMHESPQYGMLNGWNRLHAVDNVAVVDASSFTTGPEKNPTPTAMALAARAADRLASDLKAGVVPAAVAHRG